VNYTINYINLFTLSYNAYKKYWDPRSTRRGGPTTRASVVYSEGQSERYPSKSGCPGWWLGSSGVPPDIWGGCPSSHLLVLLASRHCQLATSRDCHGLRLLTTSQPLHVNQIQHNQLNKTAVSAFFHASRKEVSEDGLLKTRTVSLYLSFLYRVIWSRFRCPASSCTRV